MGARHFLLLLRNPSPGVNEGRDGSTIDWYFSLPHAANESAQSPAIHQKNDWPNELAKSVISNHD